MSSSTMTGHCAKCGEAATKYCQACAGGYNKHGKEDEKTYYCGSECQKGDWKSHKALCKRFQIYRQVYRAGELARKLFFVYREKSYHDKVLKIEFEDNDIHVHFDPCLNPNLTEGLNFKCLPHSVARKEEDRFAILAADTCVNAMLMVEPIIRFSLKGVLNFIEEQTVGLKPRARHVVYVAYPGKAKLTNPTHEILVLLLKTGERFVVDVTAAQFGFSEVVAPWQDYLDQRAESYGIFQRSGLQETATYGCMKQDHEAGGLINQVSINGYLAEFWLREFVHDTLVQWLLEKDSTASKVMLLPEEDFQTACKDGGGDEGEGNDGKGDGVTYQVVDVDTLHPRPASTAPSELVVALFDYTAQGDGYLSFKKGDCVRVTQRDDSGWSEWELDERRCWFPGDYCEPAKKSDDVQVEGQEAGKTAGISNGRGEELELAVSEEKEDGRQKAREKVKNFMMGNLKGMLRIQR